MSWRHLEDVFKTCWRRLEDVLKMSWGRLENVLKTSWRRLENVLKTSWRRMTKTNMLVLMKTSWRRLEDVFWRRMSKANIFVLIKTSWRRLLKTKPKDVSWRQRPKTSQDVFKTSSSRRMFAGLVLFFLMTFKHVSVRLANFHFEPTLKQHHLENLQIKWKFLKYQINKFTVKVLKLVLRKNENKKRKSSKKILKSVSLR